MNIIIANLKRFSIDKMVNKIIEINKNEGKVIEHNNILGLIESLKEQDKIEFKAKQGFEKTDDMCNVHYCPNKARFVWDVPFLLRIIRYLKADGNYQTSKYCKKCLKSACYRLSTPRKYWKEINGMDKTLKQKERKR